MGEMSVVVTTISFFDLQPFHGKNRNLTNNIFDNANNNHQVKRVYQTLKLSLVYLHMRVWLLKVVPQGSEYSKIAQDECKQIANKLVVDVNFVIIILQ